MQSNFFQLLPLEGEAKKRENKKSEAEEGEHWPPKTVQQSVKHVHLGRVTADENDCRPLDPPSVARCLDITSEAVLFASIL